MLADLVRTPRQQSIESSTIVSFPNLSDSDISADGQLDPSHVEY